MSATATELQCDMETSTKTVINPVVDKGTFTAMVIHLCRAEFILGKIKIYLHFSTLWWHKKLKPSVEAKYPFTQHSEYYRYNDVIMGALASQITSLNFVYSIVYSDADQRKHQSSASLAFLRGIHRGPVNSPHKWPVTRKMFPFDDVIMMASDNVARHGTWDMFFAYSWKTGAMQYKIPARNSFWTQISRNLVRP